MDSAAEQEQFAKAFVAWIEGYEKEHGHKDLAMVVAVLMQTAAMIGIAEGLSKEGFVRGAGICWDSISTAMRDKLVELPWPGCN